jgi:hypothetical protein
MSSPAPEEEVYPDDYNNGCAYHSQILSINTHTHYHIPDGPSLYNNNKGILYCFDLIGRLPSQAKTKSRQNAKPPTSTQYKHCHEEMPLEDVLLSRFLKHNQLDLLDGFNIGKKTPLKAPLPNHIFALEGSVPRKRQLCGIKTLSDFQELQTAACSKNKAEVTLKITLRERLDEDDESEEDEEGPPAKKSKVRGYCTNFFIVSSMENFQGPNREEKAQDDFIVELEREHQCGDKKCDSTACLVVGPNAEHLPLTHL